MSLLVIIFATLRVNSKHEVQKTFLSSVASCLSFLKYPEKVFKKRRTFF
nr:MAG TPA: hypothetical protein [Caudoviricetes sp.]